MKLFKKQPVALLLALLIVVGALFVGVNRSVLTEVRALEGQFINGVYDRLTGSDWRPGIHGQLTQRTTAAMRMLSVGEHSHADSSELTDVGQELTAARGALLDLLAEGAGPRALFQADQALEIAAARYYAVLHPLVVAVEGEDLAALEAAYSTMQSAARVIRDSGYNEAVVAFQRVLGAFPMNMLRPIVLIPMPELFA